VTLSRRSQGRPHFTHDARTDLQSTNVLNTRDAIISALPLEQQVDLRSAFYNGQGKNPRVFMYGYTCIVSAKVYVGSYHTTSLFERTHRHLATANALSYRPRLPWWQHDHADSPRPLYMHMLEYAWPRKSCGAPFATAA